jgi:hypothetical protein
MIVPPLKEGHIKKGGVNKPPTTPRPNIVPPPQHPEKNTTNASMNKDKK